MARKVAPRISGVRMVLCVDDEVLGLETRKLLLERLGYRVLTATNGNEALKLFKANPIRAVVLDYTMPGMNGAEVALELKRINPAVKIMMFSAHPSLPREIVDRVDVCAVKGASPTTFLSAFEQLIGMDIALGDERSAGAA